MKQKIRYQVNGETRERVVNYIPVRYILAIALTVLEVLVVIGIVIALCYYVPFFYIAAWITEIYCVIRIIASDDNPDYKVPWLLCVLVLPVAGFMLYFMFYSRKLKPKFVKRLKQLKSNAYHKDDRAAFERLKNEDAMAFLQATMLANVAETHLFQNTKQTYFPLGEDMHRQLLIDLKSAEHFIYMEYFIIEEGVFWNSVLAVLKAKAAAGVQVKVMYDDVGCMLTLPGDYAKKLAFYGIEAVPFSRLVGSADSRFNNRNHRKITVIDGKIGYTGGINLADEYINVTHRFGHWKDNGIRLEGEAVWELTKRVSIDLCMNGQPLTLPREVAYPTPPSIREQGYLIPFGDGPRPIYDRCVGKGVIQNLLAAATRYVYMMTPYLIIDNDLCTDIENTALRGVDVRILLPHVPDKKLIFGMTQSYYKRLMDAGVKIYEYEPGFLHAKSYLVDDKYAMIGSINLDYRSLVHHFENGVWMYNCASIRDLKADFDATMEQCIHVTPDTRKTTLLERFVRAVVRIFAPML